MLNDSLSDTVLTKYCKQSCWSDSDQCRQSVAQSLFIYQEGIRRDQADRVGDLECVRGSIPSRLGYCGVPLG